MTRFFFPTSLLKKIKMINLLLYKNKKRIFREFIFRLIFVWFIFLFVAILISIILVFPSHILSKLKTTEIMNQVKVAEISINIKEDKSQAKILDFEKLKLERLETKDEIKVSEILNRVIDSKPDDIRIVGFFYEKVPGKIINKKSKLSEKEAIQLSVRGIADDRNTLIDFVDKLKGEEYFTGIDFPVSNLTKGNSVDFSTRIFIKNIQ